MRSNDRSMSETATMLGGTARTGRVSTRTLTIVTLVLVVILVVLALCLYIPTIWSTVQINKAEHFSESVFLRQDATFDQCFKTNLDIDDCSPCTVTTGFITANDGQPIHYVMAVPPAGASSDFDVDGKPIAPIVLIPGFPAASSSFYCNLKFFCRITKTIAMDSRGFGLSTKNSPYTLQQLSNDTLSLITELDLVKPTVIGASLGGAIAGYYAAKAPANRIGRVVLVGTTAKLINDANWTLGLDPVLLASFGRAMNSEVQITTLTGLFGSNLTLGLETFYAGVYTDNCAQTDAVLVEEAITQAESYLNSSLVVAELNEFEPTWDFRAQVPNITIPTLVIFGTRDAFFPFTSQTYLRDFLGGPAFITEIPSGGHFVFQTNFPEFNRRVCQFIRGTDQLCFACRHFPITILNGTRL